MRHGQEAGLRLREAEPLLPDPHPGSRLTRSPSTAWLRLTSAPMRQSAPITTPGPITAPAPIRLRAPMRAPAPITANGPISADGVDLGAVADHRGRDARPGVTGAGGWNSAATRAQADVGRRGGQRDGAGRHARREVRMHDHRAGPRRRSSRSR